MKSKILLKILPVALVAVFTVAGVAFATHSWGNYHWARVTNPFTLKLGDNVSGAWDVSLQGASSDWSQSSILDTTVVAGLTNPKNCKAIQGRVEVCNSKYGNNGWLGVAQIWVMDGEHITKGTVKLNDTYFNSRTHNTSAWRNLVVCQEIGHTLGLDHQDENFSNPNLNTCMDYASNPQTNQHPNTHDYEELEAIYAHNDLFTTVFSAVATNIKNIISSERTDEHSELGVIVRRDAQGKPSVYEKDLGKGEKLVTHIFWIE